MADVSAVQTSEEAKEKIVTLKGEATMAPTDDRLIITIPDDHKAPTGRKLKLTWTLAIREEDDT